MTHKPSTLIDPASLLELVVHYRICILNAIPRHLGIPSLDSLMWPPGRPHLLTISLVTPSTLLPTPLSSDFSKELPLGIRHLRTSQPSLRPRLFAPQLRVPYEEIAPIFRVHVPFRPPALLVP